MARFLPVLLIVLSVASYIECAADPVGLFLPLGKGSYIYQGHKYTLRTERVGWEEAASLCRQEGGYLAVLEDMQEAEFVAEAMASNLCDYIAFQNVWIGGRYVDGRWVWVPTAQEIPGKIGSDGYPPWGVNVRPDKDCLAVARTFLNRPKFVDVNCARRRNFLCEQGCSQLYDTDRQQWEPPSCAEDLSDIGDNCRLVCKGEYELSGNDEITCTIYGWNSTIGYNNLPSCRTPDELGEDFVDEIDDTIGNVNANMLFLIDESVSVSVQQFEMEKRFVQAIGKAFPLSENRTAGVIAFNHEAAVKIPMKETDTCSFLKAVGDITITRGGTDIQTALLAAITEIEKNAVHNLTLVFLITDGISVRDPTPGANVIKGNGDILFTLGIADYKRDQLEPLASVGDTGRPNFFGVSSFEVFDAIASYLNSTYTNNNLPCNYDVTRHASISKRSVDDQDLQLSSLQRV